MRITRPRLIALTAVCLALTVAGVAHAATGRSPSKTAEGYGSGQPSVPPPCLVYGEAEMPGYCPPSGPLPTYTVNVINNSTPYQDLALYQRLGDGGVPNGVSLAWLTAPAHPGTTTTFTWKPEYSFVWSRTSPLQPGALSRSEQSRASRSGRSQPELRPVRGPWWNAGLQRQPTIECAGDTGNRGGRFRAVGHRRHRLGHGRRALRRPGRVAQLQRGPDGHTPTTGSPLAHIRRARC